MKKYRNVVQIVGYIKYLLFNDKYKMKCEEVNFMRKLGKKVKLDKKSLQAYAFCVCTNCPCPSGTNSYTAKYNDSERKAK